jgi:outer membrane protein OmpA-like peptidoglycan-associated protein
MACASPPPAEPVSATTTRGADIAGELELGGARDPDQPACKVDVSPDVHFAPRTAALLPGETRALEAWASCFNRPQLVHMTVVLLGGEDDEGSLGIFAQRAGVVRDLLVARGVDPQRVVIGAPNRSREGGHRAGADAVRVEATHAQTLRGMAPRPGAR